MSGDSSPAKPATNEPAETPIRPNAGALFRAFLNSPLAGLAPWIVMSILSGPGRFELSVLVALALSVTFVVAGHRRHSRYKLMEVFDLIFFAGFALIGILASPAQITWMETWAGEITNIVLTVFVLFTIVIRKPFTIEYAREQTPKEYWDTPMFIRINYQITWMWFAAFAVQAISGAYGDEVLRNNNNFWTGWVIQLAAVVFAAAFTEFWPDYASGKAQGEPTQSLWHLLDWLPVFILITGVAGLMTDGVPTVVGIALVVIGVIGMFLLRRLVPADS